MFKKVFFLAVLASSLLVFGAQATDFSADMISKNKGKDLMSGKIFSKGSKTRMETQSAITITRADKGVMWVLMPSQKTYMEMAMSPQNLATTTNAVEKASKVETQSLGKDTVDGKVLDKYRVTMETAGQKTTILQWIDPALKLPVKMSAEDSSWEIQYKNIQTSGVSDSLFELPQGYTKFQMPDIKGMMSGFGKNSKK